uniref:Ig-like domain-containing protein n=1 Tax=Pundamilia nyererei TaxID=303518 RepID=A0A3B4GYD4_9CICH
MSSYSPNHTEVKVRSGQNVTLQCQGPRGLNITLLEWSKPEFNSESYVFFFQNHRLYENYQHESFRGRVALKDRSMKDGDVSVILRNVNINDTGTYSCEITTRMKGKVVHEVVHSINLKVTDSGGFVEVVSSLANIWYSKHTYLTSFGESSQGHILTPNSHTHTHTHTRYSLCICRRHMLMTL